MIFLLIGLAALSSFLVFDNDEINSDILAAFAQTNSEKDQVMSKEFITFYDAVNHTLTTIPSDTVNPTLTTIPSDTIRLQLTQKEVQND